MMTSKAAKWRKIVEQCLDDDPDKRPVIQKVSAIIESLKVSIWLASRYISQHLLIPCFLSTIHIRF